MIWHSEKKEAVAMELQSPPKKGLTDMMVGIRLEEYGENTVEERKKKSGTRVFMGKLFSPVSLIIIIVSLLIALQSGFSLTEGGRHQLSMLAEELVLSSTQLIILNLVRSGIMLTAAVIWAVISAKRELAAEKTIFDMKTNDTATARVRRNQVIKQIPVSELVPGDIIQLEAGDIIPADGRLLITTSFICDESALTGHEALVQKDSNALLPEDTPLEKRINMAYSGTVVIAGRSLMIVTETGKDTEINKKRGSKLRKINSRTPLVRNARKIRSVFSWSVFGVCLVTLAVVIFKLDIHSLPQSWSDIKDILINQEIYDFLFTALTLMICAVPFGLPQNVLYLLTNSVKSINSDGIKLRKFKKAELIGCTSVICTDKTGTLTMNQMSVAKIWAIGDIPSAVDEGFWSDEMKYLMQCSALCCDCKVKHRDNDDDEITGDRTEAAIISAYLRDGNDIDSLLEEYPRVAEIPFDSSRKLMTVIHEVNGLYMVITKGAPDILISRCVDADTYEITKRNRELCSEGLRVIAVAVHAIPRLPDKITSETIENELTFIGLIGLLDPHREDVEEAVKDCSEAGIRTVMITGDHPDTASAIARKLGIMNKGDRAITGEQLAKMSDRKLTASIEKYSVFARITPADKVRLIRAWQSKGHCVLMTAGGLSDAPALHAADISCSAETTATDVAVAAADIALPENNFVNILSVVEKGRLIRRNLTKLTEYCITCSIAETALFVLGKLMFGQTLTSFLPIMLLNLLIFCLIQPAFANEPPEKDLMDKVPEKNQSKLWSFFEKSRSVIAGFYIALVSLISYAVGTGAIGTNPSSSAGEGITMAFAAMAGGMVIHALSTHSNKPLFSSGIFRNLKLIAGVVIVLVAIAIMTSIPYINMVFGFSSLSSLQWKEIGVFMIIQYAAWEYSKLNGYFR